jgi:chemotaxis signal transduction protein
VESTSVNRQRTPNNKPDIIICDTEKRTCMLIIKEAEKILKYKDLTIEVQHMWKVKTNVILVIIGVMGTISK